MRTRVVVLTGVVAIVLGMTAGAQVTPWLQWTLLPASSVSEIVGESSGENAWHMIMETGGYDKDRTAEEFATTFHEVQFYVDKARAYGLTGVEVVRFPGSTSWDGVKGELWEVAPIRQKLASYIDSAAMLATGSSTGEAAAELVWVGAGLPADFQGKDVDGKIVVTEGSVSAVHRQACLERGALGVVGVLNSSRALFDPLQMNWGSVGGSADGAKAAKFAFQLPPREGEYLKRRLLAGQKITVKAKVESATRKVELQDVVWSIPGTDPKAGEVILSAHLFEGYVKQGGNDDISGCAVLLEVARTLNTLIGEGRIPRPTRTIRFIIGPEFSGTGPWVKANKALMDRTFCNINLDMVGLWLSRSQSFMCLMRTTFGNPHYINDVMENYFRYVGEGNRERIQNRSSFYPVPRRIVAPTGADEPFYYSIETHYGASDHEVFNDWAVHVPGVMLIDWPDRWYHTSGDHVDKTDPTTLKRVTIIAASGAYTVASADDEMAARIASEVAANAGARLALQVARGMEELNQVTAPAALGDAWKAARSFVEAAAANEKATLETVNELAADRKRVGGHVAALQRTVDQLAASSLATLEAHMGATARRLNVGPAAVQLTDLEVKAAKVVPRPTAKVTAGGYQGYRQFLDAVPQEQRAKFPVGRDLDTAELQRLVNGRNSALDIKRMLDAQSESRADLQGVLNYLEVLSMAGLIEK
jgi:aminopeptidase YwaD